LSEYAATSAASRSTITWPPSRPPGAPASGRRRSHTAWQAAARAVRIADNAASMSAANALISLDTVGLLATCPNSSG
jgi:hypothetical protein